MPVLKGVGCGEVTEKLYSAVVGRGNNTGTLRAIVCDSYKGCW